jgi:hypothetical protein
MSELSEKLNSATAAVGKDRVAAFLLAAFTGVGALLSAVGVSGNVIGRMVRDHPVLSGFMYGFALAAVLAGLWALYRPEEKKHFWFNLGLLFYLVAGGFAVWAAIAVWGDDTSPEVIAAASPAGHNGAVDLTVKSSGLQNNQRLTLDIWPIESTAATAVSRLAGDAGGKPSFSYATGVDPLYQLVTGPDGDGNVDLSTVAHLPVDHPSQLVVEASTGPTELDDCLRNEKSGCVFLDLGGPAKPQLSASLRRRKGNPELILRTYGSGIAERLLHFKVLAAMRSRTARVAGGSLAPDSEGTLDQKTDVAVPAGARWICAIASTSPLGPKAAVGGCPPKFHLPSSAWKACRHRPKRVSFRGCLEGIRLGLQQATSWIKLAVR